MLLKDIQDIFHKELDVLYGRDEVDSFFFLCMEFYLNLPRFQLSLQPEFNIVKKEYVLFFSALDCLKQHIPIQYILGETEFYGLQFKVNNSVLIPRPETEELVDWILNSNTIRSKENELKILDIGTGSGCIAISLAKNLTNAKVYALDVSREAISLAKQNALLNDVNITFIEGDILRKTTQLKLIDNYEFDIVVSNPPYVRHLEKKEIKPNVLDHEPHLALFVKDENPLVFYNAITAIASKILRTNGAIYFEINQYLGIETEKLLRDANYRKIELRKDLNNNYRMLKGIKY